MRHETILKRLEYILQLKSGKEARIELIKLVGELREYVRSQVGNEVRYEQTAQDLRRRAVELFLKGFSVKQIASCFGVSERTVRRYLKQPIAKKRGPPKKDRSKQLPEPLRGKLRTMLLYTCSVRKIFYILEHDLKLAGINSLATFYRLVEDFVRSEWGSWENLNRFREISGKRH